jgi:HK97 family phage portal protein
MKYVDILKDSWKYLAGNTLAYFGVKKKSSRQTERTLAQILGGSDADSLNDAYRQLPIVRRCVGTRARNIAQVPFRLFKGNATEPATIGDPMVNLFESVNPWTNKFQFWELIVTYMDLFGDSAIWPTEDMTQGVPSGFILIRPTDLKALEADDGSLDYWEWKSAGKKIDDEDLILPKYANPYDRFRGLSVIGAGAAQLNSEWGAIRYNEVFYKQGQAPGSVFSTKEVLSDESYLRLKNELIDQERGVNNAHKALLIDSGLELSNVRPSNRDMEFLNQRNFTREEIGPILFSVPKHILGLDSDVNRSTAKEQELGFWKNTLIPMMQNLQAAFNQMFLLKYGYTGIFDITTIDALNEDLLTKSETAKTFWEMGIPVDEINRRMNLGFDEGAIPSGDMANWQILQNMQQPQTRQIEERGVTPGGDIDLKALIKAKRLAQWKQLDDKVTPLMAKTAKEVRQYFFEIEKKLLKKLNSLLKKAKREQKAIGSEIVMNLDEFFDDRVLIDIMSVDITEALNEGALTLADFPLPDTGISAYLQNRGSLISGINTTAKDVTMSKLQAALQQITEEGLNETQAGVVLRDALKESFKINKSRARTIARTEIGTAFTEARTQKAIELGAKEKTWIDSQDARVRETHRIHTERVAIDDTFSNGLLYPREPGAPADEVVNCRCEVLYHFEDGSER